MKFVARVGAHFDDLPYHLVAGSHPVAVNGKVALCDVQVGAADPASAYRDEQLRRPGTRYLGGDLLERAGVHRPGAAHLPRPHCRVGQRRNHQSIMPLTTTAATGLPGQVLRTMPTTQSRITAPSKAVKNVKMRPPPAVLTKKLRMKPPIKAPTMPITMSIRMPAPLPLMILLASAPARPPMMM